MEAKEEVIITRLTVGAFPLIAFSTPVVPIIAGSRRSFLVSVMLKWKGWNESVQVVSSQPLEAQELWRFGSVLDSNTSWSFRNADKSNCER
jgi:hypothetical protein